MLKPEGVIPNLVRDQHDNVENITAIDAEINSA